jgi:arylsulfatase A-like enzyme
MISKLTGFEARLYEKVRTSHPVLPSLALVMGLSSLADVWASSAALTAHLVVHTIATGLLAGALLGGVVCTVFAVLRPAPRVLRAFVWLTVGGSVGAWLCEGLGVWVTLGGPYDRLARLGLLGSGVSALWVAGIGLLQQPSRRHPYGPWSRLPRSLRWFVSGGALLLGAVFTWVDHRGYVVEYPPATAVLRWGAAFSAAWVCVELVCARGSKSATNLYLARATFGLCIVAVCVPFFSTTRLVASVQLARGYSGLSLSLLRASTDWDRDGFSSLFGDQDCRPFDAKVNPAAREVQGNGVDDNCRGGDLLVSSSTVPSAEVLQTGGETKASPMSVVYITVDTVGVQHLGTYGYPRVTTSALDRWAKQRAVIFEQAYTAGSSTALAFGANLRGVYPRRLLWPRVVKKRSGEFIPLVNGRPPTGHEHERVQRIYRLPANEPRETLPFWLERRGIQTMAVSAVHFVAADSKLVGKFSRQVVLGRGGTKEPDDEGATRQALEWLRGLEPEERYFLWVHYLGPHSPSTRDKKVRDFGSGLLNEYDHELATFDSRLAPLLDELSERQDRGEALTVIVSADHGEEFRQHRFHGHSVEEATAHIPMFVAMPGVQPRRTSALASSVDIFPTVLALTDTPAPSALDGRDLTPVVNGSVLTWERIVLMDGWVNDTNDGLPFNRVAAIGAKRRLSWDLITFAEDARDLPSLPVSEYDRSAVDARLRSFLTDYLERVDVDPRTSQ